MRDPNHFSVIGRFVKDPELRQFDSGTSLTMFSIACGRGQDRDKKDLGADFLDCKAWGKLADIICNYGRKGGQVYVEGRVVQDRWTSQDGESKQRMILEVRQMTLLGRRRDSEGDSDSQTPPASNNQSPPENDPFDDSETPF